MFNYYFNIGIIYFIIGFSVSLLLYFVFKKRVLGRFWGALIVALIGSYLGGLIEYAFFDVIEYLRNINNAVNIFPPLITSIVVVLLYSRLSERA